LANISLMLKLVAGCDSGWREMAAALRCCVSSSALSPRESSLYRARNMMAIRWQWLAARGFAIALAACSNSSDSVTPLAPDAAGTTGQVQGMQAVGGTGASAGTTAAPVAGSSSTMTAMTAGRAGGAAGGGGTSSVSAGTSAAGTAGSAGSAPAVAGSGGSAGVGEPPKDQPTPFSPTGEAIKSGDKQWMWIPFADSKCRNGSAAGISVNLNSASQKLMIYLEGGGACFDASTCGSNPASVSSKMPASDAGVFDRSKTENPVRDWNFAYVPYCTGDVHMGDSENVTVPGVTGMQQFLGRRNLQAFLNRLVPTFSNAEQVLLTGVSAGGFGASSNVEFVQWAFGSVPVVMVDDSGPAMSNKFLPTCLTDAYRTFWGLDKTILKLCGSDCPAGGDYTIDYMKHLGKVLPNLHAGLIESNQDAVITLFYGIGTNNGANDCKGVLGLTPMDGKLFEDGLLDARKLIMASFPNYGTYFPKATQHTWLGGASFYTATTGTDNVKMVDWVTGIIEGKPTTHVGP
jgi:hypothetical protein